MMIVLTNSTADVTDDSKLSYVVFVETISTKVNPLVNVIFIKVKLAPVLNNSETRVGAGQLGQPKGYYLLSPYHYIHYDREDIFRPMGTELKLNIGCEIKV